jgi:heavy metal sensor kinase
VILDRIPVRMRLTLGHAVWLSVFFAAIGLGIHRIVEHNLYQQVDAALLASAKSINDARYAKPLSPPLIQEFLSRHFGERHTRPYAQLVDLSGKVSARTPNIRVNLPVTARAWRRAERGLETFESFVGKRTGNPFRQVTLPVLQDGKFTGELIQVGAPLDSTVHALDTIGLVLWIALPAGVLLSALLGYLLTKRALKPVHDMQLAAAGLGAKDLEQRLDLPAAHDELRALAETFNGMLARLEDAFKRLRRFSGDVSHELRTPVAVLRAEAELALRRERQPEEYREALRNILTETSQMSEIIEDLLLLARAESKSVAMQWAEVDTGHFLDVIRESVQPLFDKRNVTLAMPESPEPATFRASASYLSIAIKNLLLNAAKHSAAGSTVNLVMARVGNEVLFKVIDQGEGIPAESLPYIFDPFYRADTARNRASGGAGVGLSLTKAMVGLHAGTINVESTFGQGATFTISLPSS